VHWKIGSVPIGGTVEVVEFGNARDLAWTAVTGMTVRGRFRPRDASPGKTKVTFRLIYQAAGRNARPDRRPRRQPGKYTPDGKRGFLDGKSFVKRS
jgi:hypothetical protein